MPGPSKSPKIHRKLTRTLFILQSDQICYSVLCVFSYVAAGQQRRKRTDSVKSGGGATRGASMRRTTSVSPSRYRHSRLQ